MGKIFELFRLQFFNPISLVLIVANVIIYAFALVNAQPEEFFRHYDYQPIIVRVLLIANFPSLLITGTLIVPLVFGLSGMVPYAGNLALQLLLLFGLSVFQWALIGALLYKMFRYTTAK